MQHVQRFFRLLGCLIVSLAILGWMQTTVGHAATLSNGIYHVPMKVIKADSSATSSANQFFGSKAVVRVKDDQLTVLVISNGKQYIKTMKVEDQAVTLVKTVKQQAIYQFNLTKQSSPLATTFNLTTPMGAMKETARLTLSWAQAKPVSDSVTTASLLTEAEKLAIAATKKQTSQVQVPDTTQSKQPTATTKTRQASQVAKSATAEYWHYQVLQGSKMVKSEADQYYTDLATVTPKGTGYQVTLKVKYAKSLKLGSRAVVPESINGTHPQNVTYGQQGKNYTLRYTFNVAKKSDLTKRLIPGKIHVTVPTMNISQTFPVRFRFASSGAADQASAAAVGGLPTKTARQTAKSSQPTGTSATTKRPAAKLPPTGEATNLWWVAGLLGLTATGLLWRGGRWHA